MVPKDKKGKRQLPESPFVVKNRLGKPITVILTGKVYRYFVKGDIPGRIGEIKVEHGHDVNLVPEMSGTKSQIEKGMTDYVSPLTKQTQEAEVCLKIRVSGELRYFGPPSSSTRPPKPITLPRRSRIGNMIRSRKKS